ncbi:MAG: DUF1998 domain-containing protein [Bryobacterales bacterium]|nr:DUF1998 domain-containing protein [Bryobacterales bacterium]
MTQKKPRLIGSLRRSQVITTYGPGAFVDLPDCSIVVASLDTWRPQAKQDSVIKEDRLAAKLQGMLGLTAPPLLCAPPSEEGGAPFPKGVRPRYVAARRFPTWFVVQAEDRSASRNQESARRLVQLRELDPRGRFEGRKVVATRFVRACPNGHVDDIDWRWFVHKGERCPRALWLVERGTAGDLSDLSVRCDCGRSRQMGEAADRGSNALGPCPGSRPWMGKHAREQCEHRSRLLIRTATNSYFPQIVRVLSIPQKKAAIDREVERLWTLFQFTQSFAQLALFAQNPDVARLCSKYGEADLLEAIQRKKAGPSAQQSGKQLEVNAFLTAPVGYGESVPPNDEFHACVLPESDWKTGAPLATNLDRLDKVVQAHRIREVSALAGFTRLDAEMPDIHGEFEAGAVRAELAPDPSWLPAVENRGEGIFLSLRPNAVRTWLDRPAVRKRVAALKRGYRLWLEKRKDKHPSFPGGAYILLHTLSHLLMQSVAIRCGYPATAIRERIYLTDEAYGILLYTASPDAEGTLGGLVQQASGIGRHLERALRAGALCSSDPICAQHSPEDELEERWLQGAACHNCSLIAETSCEMRNEYLDRALVVPTLSIRNAAFFEAPE